MNPNGVTGAVDSSCDHCGSATSRLHHYPLSGNRNFLCVKCVVLFSGEPACDYCDRPTFGDYRLINRAHTLSNACGVCLDKWSEDYDEAVSA